MRVTDAVNHRRSIRAFLDKPVESQVLEELLIKAARAPSGGNVQPWRVYVVNGPAMTRFRDFRDSRKPRRMLLMRSIPKA